MCLHAQVHILAFKFFLCKLESFFSFSQFVYFRTTYSYYKHHFCNSNILDYIFFIQYFTNWYIIFTSVAHVLTTVFNLFKKLSIFKNITIIIRDHYFDSFQVTHKSSKNKLFHICKTFW